MDSKLVYNPEFLREKHANLDFVNSEMIIFGGDRNISSKVSDVYLRHSRCKTKEHIFTDLKTASFIKYAINTFLASKVVFFNELHSIHDKLKVKDSWEEKKIVPEYNDIANGMIEIYKNYKFMSKNARKRAVEKFDIKHWISRHEKSFKKYLTK